MRQESQEERHGELRRCRLAPPYQGGGWGSRSALLSPALLPACAPEAPTTAGKAEVQAGAGHGRAGEAVTLRRTVPVVGTLHAYEDVPLAPKVDGRVLRILKDVGDAVVPGEVLLELDPTNYAARGRTGAAGVPGRVAEAQARGAAGDRRRIYRAPRGRSIRSRRPARTWSWRRRTWRGPRTNGSGASARRRTLDTANTKVKVAKTTVDLAETDARVTLSHARRLKAALDDAEDHLRETKLRAPTRPEWGRVVGGDRLGRQPAPLLGRQPDGVEGRDGQADCPLRTRSGWCSITF